MARYSPALKRLFFAREKGGDDRIEENGSEEEQKG
jgi:hypothetical protein